MFEGLHIECVLMQALVHEGVLRISLLLQHVTPEPTTTESVVKEEQHVLEKLALKRNRTRRPREGE